MKGGDLISMARRRARLTQRELAERVGCRQATIARWERGDRQATYEDVEGVVRACGLQLDVHLAVEDQSWWPQIATQLDSEPVGRVRRLTPPGVGDAVPVLEALAEIGASTIVIGEVAGALHGWPLVLGGDAVEVCARAGEDVSGAVFESLDARGGARDQPGELPPRRRLIVTETPPGTAGFGDLVRGAEPIEVRGRTVQVAGLLDLLRIADASPDPDARRQALAYRAVLDVQRARAEAGPVESSSDQEKIQAWLSRQTPVA
jgi:transcriptional regulator with XRE-family HTH domain